jgi:hypothetical protein
MYYGINPTIFSCIKPQGGYLLCGGKKNGYHDSRHREEDCSVHDPKAQWDLYGFYFQPYKNLLQEGYQDP